MNYIASTIMISGINCVITITVVIVFHKYIINYVYFINTLYIKQASRLIGDK